LSEVLLKYCLPALQLVQMLVLVGKHSGGLRNSSECQRPYSGNDNKLDLHGISYLSDQKI
jgi:hypothetical protein